MQTDAATPPLAPRPSLWRAWWMTTRPQSLFATTTPIAVGLALAIRDGVFAPFWAILTLIAALLLQIGTNMVNEYYDHVRGTDATSSHSLSTAVRTGQITPAAIIRVGVLCFIIGALIGIPLALRAGPIVWGLGIAGIIIGVFYTAGPFPLAYLGLGEVGVFAAMGPAMVLGTYLVQTAGRWSVLTIVAGIPIGLLVAAIMHANNLRDLDNDRAQGKRTLAVRFGRAGARREYTALVYGTYLLLLLIAPFDLWLALAGLLTLVTIPAARALVALAYGTTVPAELNGLLRGTAKLHGRFGLLWALGILVVALLGR